MDMTNRVMEIVFTKWFWITMYLSLAALVMFNGYEPPLRGASTLGIFAILGTLDNKNINKGDKYQWVSIHLLGIVLALQIDALSLW